ncbi:MAG TPA: hypothetical protein VLV89_07295 [Candidatus Acidoferrum sp.]|nr:hypothetical protein [Candidatus Acidoferrum sp.]
MPIRTIRCALAIGSAAGLAIALCVVGAAGQTAPDAKHIGEITGGQADKYQSAIVGPPSSGSCQVFVEVKRAGTLASIPSGYKIAVNLEQSGGTPKDMTSKMAGGALLLDNVPPHFNVSVGFGSAGQSSALIYRQCRQVQSGLVLVVKNPAKIADGADWLWSKWGM